MPENVNSSSFGDTIKFRCDLAYDGTDFHGWGIQKGIQKNGLRTVQGVIEAALATAFQKEIKTTVAGRTDAGVHALGQVMHFEISNEILGNLLDKKTCSVMFRNQPQKLLTADGTHSERQDSTGESVPRESAASALPQAQSPSYLSSENLIDISGTAISRAQISGIVMSKLRSLLKRHDDIALQNVTIAPPEFDARFSALARRYEYRVSDASSPNNPLNRKYTLRYNADLDIAAMNAAGNLLLGLHDWTSYSKPREGATSIRTLQKFQWRRDVSDGVLTAVVQADAFCHHMVRCLVGASLLVGKGELSPEDLVEIRDAKVRDGQYRMVPAQGLTLVKVFYPETVAEMGLQAEQAQAKRKLD